jgi:hypothetical protein
MAKIRLPGFVKRLATGRKSARRVTRPVRNSPGWLVLKPALVRAGDSGAERRTRVELRINLSYLTNEGQLNLLQPGGQRKAA